MFVLCFCLILHNEKEEFKLVLDTFVQRLVNLRERSCFNIFYTVQVGK